MILNAEVKNLLKKENTIKILATINDDNQIHVVAKDSIKEHNGNIIYLEYLESSTANKNMIYSMWFKKTVTILILGEDKNAYQIKAVPIKCIVSGPVFQKYYTEVIEKPDHLDLASVWILEPRKTTNETLSVRQKEESNERPYFKHLDKIAL